MSTHDPRKVIEELRNHLAMHDRRISFLFGAGTSSSVNIAPAPKSGEKPKHISLIPGIDGLTESCHKAISDLGADQSNAWDVLVNQCVQDGYVVNIESLLSKVRMKIDAIGDGETLVGLDKHGLLKFEKTICATIAKIVNPSETKIPSRTPHDEFASWVKKANRTVPMEIFTTNYDLLFEIAFEKARVPVFDSFVGTHRPFFYPECLDDEDLLPKANWIRVWKLHGSVNWALEDESIGKKRIIRRIPTETGELILPSHRKYDESRKQPYVGYINRLSRLLNSEHALLTTCGYSFGDQHINEILYNALDRSTVNIIALQFQNLKEDDDIVKTAVQRSNLTVIGPNGGVISGTWGRWQLSQPVDNKTSSFMDIAFDSDGLPEDEGSPASVSADLMGRIRLGDFNWFCRFLNSMGVDTQ